MSCGLRPTIFEFKSKCQKNSKWPVKSPSHLRTKTRLNLAKLKFSMEYDMQVASQSKYLAYPLQNIGLSVSQSKNTKRFSICEINDLTTTKQTHRTTRSNYFDHSKNQGNHIDSRRSSIQFMKQFEEAKPKENKSSKSIVNNLWNYSPIKEYNNTMSTWRTYRNLKKGLTEKFRGYEGSSKNVLDRDNYTIEIPRITEIPRIIEISQNCACIQTDDIEY